MDIHIHSDPDFHCNRRVDTQPQGAVVVKHVDITDIRFLLWLSLHQKPFPMYQENVAKMQFHTFSVPKAHEAKCGAQKGFQMRKGFSPTVFEWRVQGVEEEAKSLERAAQKSVFLQKC